MANVKTTKSRIQLKHDYEANWNDAEGFIPLAGEIIIYDADIDAPTSPKNLRGTNHLPRIKIGDGVSNVIALPFINDIGCGVTDPDANIKTNFYFKYNS